MGIELSAGSDGALSPEALPCRCCSKSILLLTCDFCASSIHPTLPQPSKCLPLVSCSLEDEFLCPFFYSFIAPFGGGTNRTDPFKALAHFSQLWADVEAGNPASASLPAQMLSSPDIPHAHG